MTDQATPPEEPTPEPEHPLLIQLRNVPGLEGLDILESHGKTEVLFSDPMRIVDVCRYLKETPELAYDMLLDIVAIDYWSEDPRFGLSYNLHSLEHNQRLFVKIRVPFDDPYVPTLTELWSGANWMEREAFDMMGIRFQGHPDLRKILTPDDLDGHPLRKDFPLGNVDVWPEGADTIIAR